MADADEIELVVEGRSFTGWETVEVTRSMEAASGTFSMTVSGKPPVRITDGQEVTVRAAGEVVVRGYVDDVSVDLGARQRSQTIAGRDKTADLVDCSELSEPGEWFEIDLLRLLELIAAPFGVEVRSQLEEEVEPFARFARQAGESAWSAIERACRLRGVLGHSSGDGALLVTRPGRQLAQAPLIEGRNVLSARVRATSSERFSRYVVRAQTSGTDDFYADQAALVEGTADDEGVGRYRPLLVLAEGPLFFEDAQDRARWEASVRAARAATVSVSVQGWRQRPGGNVWALNELTQVVLQGAGLDQQLLVNELRFSRSPREGTLTTIGLTRRDAYDPQPTVDQDEGIEFGEDLEELFE